MIIDFSLIRSIRDHHREGTLHKGNTEFKGREIELCELVLALTERKERHV